MMINERIICRSNTSVSLVEAGVSLKKRHTVMHHIMYGGLLIEMEDNEYSG